MGNASNTYRGPNGGKQKLSAKARADKQARDKGTAMTPLRKHAKITSTLKVKMYIIDPINLWY